MNKQTWTAAWFLKLGFGTQYSLIIITNEFGFMVLSVNVCRVLKEIVFGKFVIRKVWRRKTR